MRVRNVGWLPAVLCLLFGLLWGLAFPPEEARAGCGGGVECGYPEEQCNTWPCYFNEGLEMYMACKAYTELKPWRPPRVYPPEPPGTDIADPDGHHCGILYVGDKCQYPTSTYCGGRISWPDDQCG